MDTDLIARERLEEEIIRAMDRACAAEVRWGVDDCALWVADIVRAATGHDPAASFRGRYSDRDGANAALGPLGLGMAIRTAARARGWKAIAPEHGQVGDVGLTALPALIDGMVERRLTTFICRTPGLWIARGARGYAAVPSSAIRFAWAVL